jgi:hypothetical protein
VCREGEEQQARAQLRQLRSGHERVLILPPDEGPLALRAASSTRVREALKRGDRAAVAAMCGEAVAAVL